MNQFKCCEKYGSEVCSMFNEQQKNMSAFALFDNISVNDLPGLEAYKAAVLPVVQQFGGKYRAVGGRCRQTEGNWVPTYLVMIEFDNFEKANQWYDSVEYAALKEKRLAAVETNAIIFEGLP